MHSDLYAYVSVALTHCLWQAYASMSSLSNSCPLHSRSSLPCTCICNMLLSKLLLLSHHAVLPLDPDLFDHASRHSLIWFFCPEMLFFSLRCIHRLMKRITQDSPGTKPVKLRLHETRQGSPDLVHFTEVQDLKQHGPGS